MQNKALIIDDDKRLLALLREYLEGNGYQVMTLTDGSGALETISSEHPDIIILDVMLPGKDGLEILKEIRKEYRIPVIMLTAKGEETDRIVGLELGADDYLPKPFNPRELLARIRAVLRRALSVEEGASSGEDRNQIIKSGGLELNGHRQSVSLGGREVELSTTEFKILEALMSHPNMVLSREQLMNLARGKDFMAFDRSIDVHISKLRAKLESDLDASKRIRTVWGSGYMFVDGQ